MSSAAGSGGADYLPSPPPFPYSFHLLEFTIISAQDLFPASRSMRTYAIVWVDPDHRLRTSIDSTGHNFPSWNDKFVFRIPDATLRSSTSAVTIEIYAARGRLLPGKPTLIGTARAVLSTLRPASSTHFTALQVRRPSLRPQGILNIGVTLLDAYAKSMPLHAGIGASKAVEGEKVEVKKSHAGIGASKAVEVEKVEVKKVEAKMERKGSVRVASRAEREKMEVELKLQKWRAELPPLQDSGEKGKGKVMVRRRRSFGRLSCLSGVGENVEGDGGRGI